MNLYVLVTVFAWGLWGIFDKKALGYSSHLGVLVRLYSMALWQAPLVYAVIRLTEPESSIHSQVWLWTLVAAISQLVSFAAYFRAMSITDASLVLGVTAAYPLITQILAVVILHEPLVAGRMLGGIAIAIGVFAIGATQSHGSAPLSVKQRLELIFCIAVATCGWGLWGILDKKALAFGSPWQVWLADCIWQLCLIALLLGYLFMIKRPPELANRAAWGNVFLSAISIALGRITFLYALTIATASYVITMTGCYPLIMYFFAIVWLKERFSKLRFAGIVLVVIGGLAVQLTQSK